MSDFLTKEMIYQKSPQELTALLYEKCLTDLEQSVEYIHSKDYVLVNQRLQNASDILQRLGAGINYEAGIIADQLDAMYNYMADTLIEANYNKDISLIKEVHEQLQVVAQAWNEALKKPVKAATVNRSKALAYEKSVLIDQ